MDDVSDIFGYQGRDVHDLAGERLGRLDQIYVDVATNQPRWAKVEVYALGAERIVPLGGAALDGGGLRIAYPKELVIEAPAAGPSIELAPDGLGPLRSHYRLAGTMGPIRKWP